MQGFRADASIFDALKNLDFEIFQLVTGTSATSFAADRSISIHLHLAAWYLIHRDFLSRP
ncbi:MAG: hypothetical protein AAF600_04815 [Bacteroidota bacterium]